MLLFPILLGGFLGLAWFLFSNWQASKTERHRLSMQEVRILSEKMATRQRGAVGAFERKVDEIVTLAFAEEKWRIDAAAAGLTGWKECAYLSYLYAFDSITGDTSAGIFIGNTVNPAFGSPLRRALPLIHQEFAVLSAELDLAAREYFEAVKRVSESMPNGGKIADFSSVSQPILPTQESVKVAIQTTLNASALGVDAIFIPQLVVQIRTVLQAVVSRITASFATSGTLVLADGPLPVGDIIGVVVGLGGSIWSTCDLHTARENLGPSVRTRLQQQYQSQQISLRKIAHEQAYLLLKTYENIQPAPSSNKKS